MGHEADVEVARIWMLVELWRQTRDLYGSDALQTRKKMREARAAVFALVAEQERCTGGWKDGGTCRDDKEDRDGSCCPQCKHMEPTR